MGRNRFVQPEVVRLTLSDGDFIDVKRELTAGEHRRVLARMVKTMPAGKAAELDPEQVGKARILEYVLGWSLTDNHGKPVEFSEGALDGLDQDTYREIQTAIEAHEAQLEREREAKKKTTAGEPVSSAI